MFLSHGSVKFLVVLYSINVFITFFLSQLGMVRYWIRKRRKIKGWLGKLAVNGVGLAMTAFILFSVIIIKFNHGGWLTILITGTLILVALSIKGYYKRTLGLLKRLDKLIDVADISKLEPVREQHKETTSRPVYEPESKTAVIMVSGYNGMGLHTLFNVIRLFGKEFKNFFFIQAGIVDTGNFKGAEEMDRLKTNVESNLDKYVRYMQSQGYYSRGFSAVGVDVADEIANLASDIFREHPKTVFFGGQIVFAQQTILTKALFNYTTFAVQGRLHQQGIPFIIMPIRVN
jgi:K+ transporter